MATTRWIPNDPEGPEYYRAAEGLLPVDGAIPRHLVKILISAFPDGRHIEVISKVVIGTLAKLPTDAALYKAVVPMKEPSVVFTTGEAQEDKRDQYNPRWAVPFVAYVYDAAKA